jgi:hypothetical protein
MALYSLFVEHEGKPFSTQMSAPSAREVAESFFSHPMAKSLAPALEAQDIIYVTPMENLVNAWAICAGREGRYISITCFRTEQEQGT